MYLKKIYCNIWVYAVNKNLRGKYRIKEVKPNDHRIIRQPAVPGRIACHSGEHNRSGRAPAAEESPGEREAGNPENQGRQEESGVNLHTEKAASGTTNTESGTEQKINLSVSPSGGNVKYREGQI